MYRLSYLVSLQRLSALFVSKICNSFEVADCELPDIILKSSFERNLLLKLKKQTNSIYLVCSSVGMCPALCRGQRTSVEVGFLLSCGF